MRNYNDKSKNLFFDNHFLNLNFSITVAFTKFKCCFLILHTHPEGTMSQISVLGLSFYFMPTIWKLFAKFHNFIF